jgi:hypothetical protein
MSFLNGGEFDGISRSTLRTGADRRFIRGQNRYPGRLTGPATEVAARAVAALPSALSVSCDIEPELIS